MYYEYNPKICLNMIVKNESKIITRLLDSVLPIIDYYCICDTGSTDDTIDIIKRYMKEKNIKGTVIECAFKNFEYNRTHAIKAACNMKDVDYILLLDADMVLNLKKDGDGKYKFDKKILWDYDAISILQGDSDFHYSNIRLVKKHENLCYAGVTHEHIVVPNEFNRKKQIDIEIMFIEDIGDGGCKDDKYSRDIKLLTDGLEKEPNNSRYAFYLANSYYCTQDYKMAIKYYKKTIELNPWIQEMWYSYYRIGLCYENLNQMSDAVYSWLKAFDVYQGRIENLHKLLTYYISIGNNNTANIFYSQAEKILETYPNKKHVPTEDLFVEANIYKWEIYYNYIIMIYYVQGNNTPIEKINNAIVNVMNNANSCSINTTLSNMKFYKKLVLDKLYTIDITDTLELEHPITKNKIKFYSSTPCISKLAQNSETYDVNIRYVNYQIGDRLCYTTTSGDFITHNKYIRLNKNFEPIYEKNFNLVKEDWGLIGVEDIRIFPKNGEYKFIGTAVCNDYSTKIRVGNYNSNEDVITSMRIDSSFNNEFCEKNWVYTEYYCNDTNNFLDDVVIYKWHPLTICKINDGKLYKLKEKNTPSIYQHVRGSSCSQKVGEEMWFISHIVSVENSMRYYYHIITITDLSLNIIKYTAPFKISDRPIDYSVSMIVEDNRVIIPHSVWDSNTKINIYDRKYIESLLVFYP